MRSAVADVADIADLPGEGGDGELAGLLDRLDLLFARYVVFPRDEARWATAAWVVHAHTLDAWDSTPRLALLSPEKGSGKTRALEVLDLVVPNPSHTMNISAAALFRLVGGETTVTLLMDEADTFLGWKVAKDHEDIRALVNAGHRRGVKAHRAVATGSSFGLVKFEAFAPIALAGIGDLPDTITDRSIVVPMKRRGRHEPIKPFRLRHAERETTDLRDWLFEWGPRNVDALIERLDATEMPTGIEDRAADVWEPLVVIGDHAGERWSARIRGAAGVLNEVRQQNDPSLGVQLLGHMREIFDQRGVDRLSTEEVCDGLNANEEWPWGDIRGEPLNSRKLATRLRKYDIRPSDHRFGDKVKKGYLRADFHDVWGRYLAPVPSADEAQQPQQPQPGDVFDERDYEHDYPDLFVTAP